jgi:hypothetical protein
MKLKLKIKKNLNLSYNASKKRSFKKNDINNKSMINPTYLLSDVASKEFELKNNDISALSNANLNIIKVLNECVNEDIYDNSSYLVKKDVNIKSYEKVMKSKSPIHKKIKKIFTINSMENKKYQSNKTNLTKISNKANLSIDIDNNNSISSIKKSIINPNLKMS